MSIVVEDRLKTYTNDKQSSFEGMNPTKDGIYNNEEIEVFKPNFADDDMAFERLLFTCIGLFLYIVRKADNSTDYQSGLLVFSFWNKEKTRTGSKSFTFNSDEELLIALFDGIYNFYPDIDLDCNRYDVVYIEFIPMSGGKKLKFRLVKERKNRGEGRLIFHYDGEKKGYEDWNDIGKEISKLYASDYVINDINYTIQNMMEASKKIWDDIFNKAVYEEIYEGKVQSNCLYTFPTKQNIVAHNEAYFDLAKLCIREYSVFTQSVAAQKIVNDILNFGVIPRMEEPSEPLWLLSPFALNSLRNIYERTIAFSKEIRNVYAKESDKFVAMLENDFVTSCVVDFKRWVYINGIRTLITFEGQNNFLRHYPCDDLSSVVLVRVIRLYEKIISYYESWKTSKKKRNPEEINICIIGYTRDTIPTKSGEYILAESAIPEMEELRKLVGKRIEHDIGRDRTDNKPTINYKVIMNNHTVCQDGEKLTGKNYDNITIEYSNYDELFERKMLEQIIEDNDLMFFIDCPNLYCDDFYPQYGSTWNNMYMMFADTTYDLNYYRAGLGNTMGRTGILSEVDKQLTTLTNNYPVSSGTFNPVVKDFILDHINKMTTKNKHSLKTAYCYFSTLETLGTNKYKHMKITHTERYNNKSFYIIKNSNEDEIKIGISKRYNGDEKPFSDMVMKPISFSFWNLIKNISIHLKETIFDFVGTKTVGIVNGKVDNQGFGYTTPYLLDCIVLQLSWDRRMENYMIYYGIDTEVDEIIKNAGFDKMELQKILVSIFNIVLGRQKSMIGQSIRDAVCNVLLGRAEDAIHLLNYYRIKTSDLTVNTIVCDEIIDKTWIGTVQANNKISPQIDKKLYLDAMSELGSYSVDGLRKIALKNHILDNEGDNDFIIENIHKACDLCNYTNSVLYTNTGV